MPREIFSEMVPVDGKKFGRVRSTTFLTPEQASGGLNVLGYEAAKREDANPNLRGDVIMYVIGDTRTCEGQEYFTGYNHQGEEFHIPTEGSAFPPGTDFLVKLNNE